MRSRWTNIASTLSSLMLEASNHRVVCEATRFSSASYAQAVAQLRVRSRGIPQPADGDSKSATRLRRMCGDSVDHAKVGVHRKNYLWFNLQSKSAAVIPTEKSGRAREFWGRTVKLSVEVGGRNHETRRAPRAFRMLILSLALASDGCAASSAIESAAVLDQDGVPCFAVTDAVGSEALDLQSLFVSETKSADWKTLPKELWSIRVAPAGASIDWLPISCIPYGQAPSGTDTQVPAQPLALRHVYTVFIGARAKREQRNVLGYKAQFCVVEAAGRRIAREVSWDAAASKWRYDVCEKK